MERIYTVNLRREVLKVARWRRAERAVRALRAFVKRHMKVEEDKVKLSERLNNYLWHRGAKNPPTRVRIIAKKLEDGRVEVDIYELTPKAKVEGKEKGEEKKEGEGKEEKRGKEERKEEKGRELKEVGGKGKKEG